MAVGGTGQSRRRAPVDDDEQVFVVGEDAEIERHDGCASRPAVSSTAVTVRHAKRDRVFVERRPHTSGERSPTNPRSRGAAQRLERARVDLDFEPLQVAAAVPEATHAPRDVDRKAHVAEGRRR